MQITAKFACHPYDYHRNTCVLCIQNHLSVSRLRCQQHYHRCFFFAHMVLNYFFQKCSHNTNQMIASQPNDRQKKRGRLFPIATFINMKQTREILLKTIYIPSYQDVIFLGILEFSTSLAIFFLRFILLQIQDIFFVVVFASCAIVIAFHVDASSIFMAGTKLKSILFPDIYLIV